MIYRCHHICTNTVTVNVSSPTPKRIQALRAKSKRPDVSPAGPYVTLASLALLLAGALSREHIILLDERLVQSLKE